MKLYFSHSAKDENEATPLGNGHIGLWVYRGAEKEIIHLNEGTFWSGKRKPLPDSHFYERTRRTKELLLQGKYLQAEKEMCKGGNRINTSEYDPIGDLLIDTPGEKYGGAELDMKTAVLSVVHKKFSRTYFVSKPDNVFVIHMKADTPSDVSFGFLKKNEGETKITNDSVIACGRALDEGMAFCAYVTVIADVPGQAGERLCFRGAKSLTVIGTVTTGFVAWDKDPICDYEVVRKEAEERVEQAKGKSFDLLLNEHISDYRRLFDRGELVFGKEEEGVVPEEALKKEPTPALITAYFEFSKYLTISASREDSQAMNLQGLWNNKIHPSWRSNYTININTEMNYWFADCADLSECYRPFEELVRKISVSGEEVAKKMLGADGFCCFHNTDIWGFCTSVDEMMCYSYFPLAGVWMTCELMNHYRYTLDRAFLERVYPIIKKACDFLLSFLTEFGGELITVPSTSPEHLYKQWFCKRVALTTASTCDMFLCRQLFDDFLESSAILEKTENCERVKTVKEKLHKPTIDKKGRLDEFHPGVKEKEKGHRHFSHLIGAFPLMQVGYFDKREYIDAVKKSLDYRLDHGSGYTGWSCGWALNLLEVTHDRERFLKYLGKLFRHSTYPNMLDKHPPFQIDGNFGAGRAIAGMVATSEGGVIELFPIRVEQNRNGRVKNLCMPGGYKLCFSWKDHRPEALYVYSETAETVSFRNGDDGSVVTYDVRPGEYTLIGF